MIAEIICVGTELLLGDILNTNAQYLSRKLAELGVSVYYQSVVGDNEGRLLETINLASIRSDLIILSGGLGPTSDDITKETVAKALDLPLIKDDSQEKKILDFFSSRNYKMTTNNIKQAYIPKDAKVLENNNGTAPGILIEKNNVTYIILPGPPNELIPMFEENVVEYIRKKTSKRIVSRTLKLIGIGESAAAEKIQELIDNQTNPSIAPYAKLSEVHFRLTAKTDTDEEAMQRLNECENKINSILKDFIYTNEHYELEEVIVNQLIDRNLTISLAESCTGGLVASTIVNCPGASSVFKEAIIVYSNESKINLLGVKAETLEEFGAVSEETVREMATNMKDIAKTNIAVSVSGIAGPSGGTSEKPVGLVYICIAYEGKTYVKKLQLLGNRMKVRTNAAKQALIYLYQVMKEDIS